MGIGSTPTNNGPQPPRKKPGAGEKLLETNKALVGKIAQDTLDIAKHPVSSLKTLGKEMAYPLLHPVKEAKALAKKIKEDPKDGLLDAAQVVGGAVCVGAVAVAGVTGLAALALPGAAGLAAASGTAFALAEGAGAAKVALASDVPGVVLHEVRGAKADSAQAAADEGQNAASYVEDGALALVGGHVDMPMRGFFDKHGVRPGAARGASNVVGLSGTYDAPPDQNQDQPEIS